MTRSKFSLFAAFALLLVVATFYMRPWFARPPLVEVVSVREEPVVRMLVATGRIKPADTVNMQAKIGGQIRELLVDEGTRVKAGDTLARLDDTQAQAAVAQVQAQLEGRKADLNQAQRDLARAQQLKARGIVGTAQLEKSQTDVARIGDDVQRIEALLREARAKLNDSVLVAPFDAIVLARPLDAGQVVDNKTVIFELASTLDPVVETEVDELYARELSPGMMVKFSPAGSGVQTFDGQLVYVSPKIDPRTGGRILRGAFKTLPQGLLPGQSVDVNILVERHEKALTVPRSAIGEPRQAPFVLVVNAAGGLERVPMSFVDWPAPRVVVTSGLSNNTRVVRNASGALGKTRIRPFETARGDDEMIDKGVFTP